MLFIFIQIVTSELIAKRDQTLKISDDCPANKTSGGLVSCLCGCFGNPEDRVQVGVDHLTRAWRVSGGAFCHADDGGDEDCI